MPTVQCFYCNQLFLRIPSAINKQGRNFCSHSCSAKYSNGLRGQNLFCIYCDAKLPKGRSNRKYCSARCQVNLVYKQNIQYWKEGKKTGLQNTGVVTSWVKKYLIELKGEQCWKCGWNQKHPKTGKVPLEANHIDGDYRNNQENNLELICPNCHSLTDTYRGMNKGNGRQNRK